MEKIVDASGHNAGYATFVETMAKQVEELNRLKIYMGHEVWRGGCSWVGDILGVGGFFMKLFMDF